MFVSVSAKQEDITWRKRYWRESETKIRYTSGIDNKTEISQAKRNLMHKYSKFMKLSPTN